MSLSWLSWKSFSEDLLSLSFSFSFLGIILLDSSFEGFSALTSTQVFNSNVKSLGNNSSTELFVHDYTDCVLIHIEHFTCLTLVELVRHAFVNASICNNINKVSLFIGLHDF
mgnify:CR=1 FL=1